MCILFHFFLKVDVFYKPRHPGIKEITRAQTNEMIWATKHLLPEKEVNMKGAIQKDLRGKVKNDFWFRYTKIMRGVDKRAKVVPLSRYSPGALQKLWQETIAPNSLMLAKEVHSMNRGEMKLLDVAAANKTEDRISLTVAPPTQSPPT